MTDEMERDDFGGAPEGDEGGPADARLSVDSREYGDEEASPGGEIEELKQELKSLNDRHLRLAAEFDNYRKRNERDRQALATRLQADLITSLLDVLDDLQRVEASADEGTKESLLEGFRLVEKKLVSVLEAAGLQPVDAEGKPFNPEYMEALMSVPTDNADDDHRVADVFQRGYLFRDVLVRPARVRVFQYEGPAGGGE